MYLFIFIKAFINIKKLYKSYKLAINILKAKI
jgi:hypothetical protein